jgi:hypothetical protein
MLDRFLIRDGFVARTFDVRLARRIDVALPDAGGIDAEHRNQLFQMVALAGGTGWFGFQNKRFELLTAVEAFKVVQRHRDLLTYYANL